MAISSIIIATLTITLIRIHVLWLFSLKTTLSLSPPPSQFSTPQILALFSHAGVGLSVWMAAWMLIGRCNKVFEVCNTLLQNHNVKILFESGDSVLLDSIRPLTLSPWLLLKALTVFPFLLLCFCPMPIPSCSPSPHILISPTSFNIHFCQKGLSCSDMFWMMSRCSKFQHVRSSYPWEKRHKWTHQGGGRIIALATK